MRNTLFTIGRERSSGGAIAFRMVHRIFSVQRTLNQALRLVDTIADLALYQRLSVKAFKRNMCIRSNNNTICIGDVRRRQFVFYAGSATRFNLYRNAALLRVFFKRFRCHIRVCNARWTGSYC